MAPRVSVSSIPFLRGVDASTSLFSPGCSVGEVGDGGEIWNRSDEGDQITGVV